MAWLVVISWTKINLILNYNLFFCRHIVFVTQCTLKNKSSYLWLRGEHLTSKEIFHWTEVIVKKGYLDD